MSSSMPSPVPVLIAVVLLAGAVAVAIFEGIAGGSVVGGVLAACAVIPAVWGMFGGMQSKGSFQVLYAVVALFASLGLAIALWTLKIIDWVR